MWHNDVISWRSLFTRRARRLAVLFALLGALAYASYKTHRVYRDFLRTPDCVFVADVSDPTDPSLSHYYVHFVDSHLRAGAADPWKSSNRFDDRGVPMEEYKGHAAAWFAQPE